MNRRKNNRLCLLQESKGYLISYRTPFVCSKFLIRRDLMLLAFPRIKCCRQPANANKQDTGVLHFHPSTVGQSFPPKLQPTNSQLSRPKAHGQLHVACAVCIDILSDSLPFTNRILSQFTLTTSSFSHQRNMSARSVTLSGITGW